MFHMERRKYGRGAWWEQMGVRWRGRWTRRHWVCAEKGWCMLIAFFAAEQCDKGPADGSHWPTVTPEEMRCYNNDILRHKASVFSRLCTATSPMATLYVVLSHSNSHCRCIQIVYCIAWILQSSLCSSTTPPSTPCLSLRGYLHTFHPTQTVFVAGLWEMWSPRQELPIDSRLSSPSCQKLLWIQFPES